MKRNTGGCLEAQQNAVGGVVITSLRQMTPRFSGCVLREASSVLRGCEKVHLGHSSCFKFEHVIKSKEPRYLTAIENVIKN